MFKIEKLNTYVLNLDRRPDRLKQLNLPIKWERFSATDGQIYTDVIPKQRGWRGCYDSHTRLINGLKNEKSEYYLIFEDDVEVCDNFIEKLEKTVNQLPEDWELLFLGGWNVGDKINHSVGIDIANKVYCMHAYMVKSNALDKLIEKYNSRIYKVDVLLAELLPELKSYICNPTIAWQRPGFSDIENRETNNVHLR